MEVVEGEASVDDLEAFLAELRAVGDDHGVAVQALDARSVADRTHLERAVTLASRAIARDDAIADDPAIELLVYAAGRRQIQRAFELGVEPGAHPVVVVVHDFDADDWPAVDDDESPGMIDDSLDWADECAARPGRREPTTAESAAATAVCEQLSPATTLGPDGARDDDRLRELFDVADRELAAAGGDLAGLVHERVAMLVVER